MLCEWYWQLLHMSVKVGSVVSTVMLFGNKMMISSFFVSCVLSFLASNSLFISAVLWPTTMRNTLSYTGLIYLMRLLEPTISLTLSPRKAIKPASLTVTNSRKAEMPVCRSLIYSHKAEVSAWKFKKKLLNVILRLGVPGLGTACCVSSGVRGLMPHTNVQC